MSDSCENFVLASATQAANTFLPIFTRTIASRPEGALLGFWTGSTTFLGTDDPFVSMGYIGATGEVQSTFALEGDWNTGNGHITELYWQIIQQDGVTSRRPFYGKYDRELQRTIEWQFMIGNGVAAGGGTSPQFSVNWDDDTGPVGVNCFSVTPNRLSLYAVATGGIAADQTRLRLYSATGKGSAISMTYNGQDAEGSGHPTWLLATVGAGQANLNMNNVYCGEFHAASTTVPVLYLNGAIKLGDASGTIREAIWGATGVPSNSLGNNNDWCISDNGHFYFKTGGAWVEKI